MKEATDAYLDIEIFVNCPHCDFLIDLLNEGDTNNHNHNEEGHVIRQACGDGLSVDLHKQFEVNNVTCSECENAFNVKGLTR
tara:strand:- start:1771 stop:2016 length:246 start_codon:yes stop_codon:yes gene_type:complete